jgi:CubicO group peptidase (beta-lactamase class C family)
MATRSSALSALLAFVLAVAGAGASVASAQTVPALDLAAIDAHLRGEVSAHRLPGLAVTVVDGDRVLMARGYGSAGGGRPITPQTQFYIGSCTKSFTALAVMQLVDEAVAGAGGEPCLARACRWASCWAFRWPWASRSVPRAVGGVCSTSFPTW